MQTNDERLREMQDRIRSQSDSKLLAILNDKPGNWTPEALAFAKNEAESREGLKEILEQQMQERRILEQEIATKEQEIETRKQESQRKKMKERERKENLTELQERIRNTIREEETTNGPATLKHFISNNTNICALGLIIFFFLPWINIGGIMSYSGYQIGRAHV